jgi:hypothetical protein
MRRLDELLVAAGDDWVVLAQLNSIIRRNAQRDQAKIRARPLFAQRSLVRRPSGAGSNALPDGSKASDEPSVSGRSATR